MTILHHATILDEKVAQVVPDKIYSIATAWNLTKMLFVAAMFDQVADRLVKVPDKEVNIKQDIVLLRRIAIDIKGIVNDLLNDITTVNTFSDEIIENSSDSVDVEDSDIDFVQMHRDHAANLLLHLTGLGINDYAAEHFTDNLLDLWYELKTYMLRIDQLLQLNSREEIALALDGIVAPWDPLGGWHGRYHLGDYADEGNQPFNAGFIGWSLVVLSDLKLEWN